ncbi:MAG TPA: hypothetical protein VEI74_03720 [Candidatus Methylomirabilis sp.]|nr:hypothetical protein [Candidatus Methylomirabilis sp.]
MNIISPGRRGGDAGGAETVGDGGGGMDGAGLGADGLGAWAPKGEMGGGVGCAAGGIASPSVRGCPGVGDGGCNSSAAKLTGASNKPQAIRPTEQEAR